MLVVYLCGVSSSSGGFPLFLLAPLFLSSGVWPSGGERGGLSLVTLQLFIVVSLPLIFLSFFAPRPSRSV